MRTVSWSIVGLIACLAGLVGCGGNAEQADEHAISGVFARLDQAQRRGDAELACDKVFLVQEAFEARTREKDKGGDEAEREEREREAGDGEAGESPEACRRAFRTGQATRRKQVRALRTKLETVKVDGETATATVRATVTRTDGSSFSNVAERDLVRHDGHWRIRISPEG